MGASIETEKVLTFKMASGIISPMKNKGIEKLKQLMDERKLTQAMAAEMSGVKQPTISRHISGERVRVDPEVAVKYEAAFGIPKEEFVFLVSLTAQ